MNLESLNLFEFSDFRKFLSAYHSERQARDKLFTRSRFCKELGLPNTRSYFNDIVKGRRQISGNYIERFIQALSLTPEEADYFRILVFYDQSLYEQQLEALFGREMSLKKWRNTAAYDELKNRLCLRAHRAFLTRTRKKQSVNPSPQPIAQIFGQY